MRSIVFIFIFNVLGLMCYAQPASTLNQEITSSMQSPKAAKGTYQFIASLRDSNVVFTDDILIIIESLRAKNNIVYYEAAPGIKIKILPLSMIYGKDFRPLEEWIYSKED